MQPKKEFAHINYALCDPKTCDPEGGRCSSAKACTRKVMKQIDGPFEPPMVFQDLCMNCWECIEACPLQAVERHRVS